MRVAVWRGLDPAGEYRAVQRLWLLAAGPLQSKFDDKRRFTHQVDTVMAVEDFLVRLSVGEGLEDPIDQAAHDRHQRGDVVSGRLWRDHGAEHIDDGAKPGDGRLALRQIPGQEGVGAEVDEHGRLLRRWLYCAAIGVDEE